ncbi:MAG TPA: DUF3368 domain-containing protein [Hanamia sp.]|nr:DUF3368 domain-containing protein [Hanamia sp.]
MKDNFSDIIIPQIVHNEILQLSEKYDLSKYLHSDWITINAIKNNKLFNQLLKKVDEGESEAIVLSQEIHADLLLIDERKGTELARSFGISTIGLLGVLLLSKEQKIIPRVQPILDELIANTTFRITKTLYTNVLKQANEL